MMQVLNSKGIDDDNDNETIEGMDISLCVIDHEYNTLTFSAASQPMMLVRENELMELKGNRISIGITERKDLQFTKEVIELEVGDTIYLYSDGYYDQFGGKDSRKMLNKRFKEFILKNKELSML
jgi:serine phosphatase RsbU (regulator of sigma subunit)